MTAHKELMAALEPLVQRVRADVTATKGPKGMGWTREPLTPDRLAKHLNGGPARGVCPIKAGESVTMVGLLDLDSHKGESTWEQMADAALQVVEALSKHGMEPVCFRSSGGNGIHVYVLWDAPQDAYSVRLALANALADAGFSNGTGGVSRGQIEVFPKQDSVALFVERGPVSKLGLKSFLILEVVALVADVGLHGLHVTRTKSQGDKAPVSGNELALILIRDQIAFADCRTRLKAKFCRLHDGTKD